jgi:tRNA pseudouridine32 synthase/23S rRNA pseudouridine746 synthase
VKHFIPFTNPINTEEIPKKFPFPFCYEPDALAKLATKELQNYLKNTKDLQHNFGFNTSSEGLQIGKMFGVLVVQKPNGSYGYLAAFSGKLMGENNTDYFVPAVFDMFSTHSFYNAEKEVLMQFAAEIEILEKNPILLKLQKEVQAHNDKTDQSLTLEKEKLKKRKQARNMLKRNAKNLSIDALEKQQKQLALENIQDNFYIRELSLYYQEQIAKKQAALDELLAKIQQLKEKQVATSHALSKRLMEQYHFLDSAQNKKSLLAIFENTPPAGAGECAAPKLLQYAFLHHLKVITMAEFWWGKAPNSIIRKHGNFYPSCRGKCEPILGHMLQNTIMDDNPLLANKAEEKSIEIIYEDDEIAVINKPSGLLSVPGKTITDSVYSRMKEIFPNATGPLIVHRLDMDTSGILLIAKSLANYKILQAQFINRSIQKRYVALLDGVLTEKTGFITLPIRVDLNDRPKQLVCYDYGKPAKTKWEVISIKDNKTKVYFYPITGRTHQLRVHAAHQKGLNTAIIGDDLYGRKAERLYLHAEFIAFLHPKTGKKIKFKVDAGFFF